MRGSIVSCACARIRVRGIGMSCMVRTGRARNCPTRIPMLCEASATSSTLVPNDAGLHRNRFKSKTRFASFAAAWVCTYLNRPQRTFQRGRERGEGRYIPNDLSHAYLHLSSALRLLHCYADLLLRLALGFVRHHETTDPRAASVDVAFRSYASLRGTRSEDLF